MDRAQAAPEPDRPETVAERVGYWTYASAETVATALPERVGRRLFSLTASARFHRAHAERRVVERNLARVLGHDPSSPVVRAAVRDAFQSYARYWYESFRLRVMSPEEVRKRFEIRGIEHIDAALERGRGALMALPHLGNWDVAGHYMAISGYSLTAVAEHLRPPRLTELMRRHREQLGMGIVQLAETRKIGERLARLIDRNELIALVCDRDLRGTGVDVEMFGATRKMPAGPALLSLGTGSPLLPAAIYDTEDGWLCLIDPPLEIDRTDDLRGDVATLTRRLAEVFERSIAANPTQWHMFQPAWPEEEPPPTPGPGPGPPRGERAARSASPSTPSP